MLSGLFGKIASTVLSGVGGGAAGNLIANALVTNAGSISTIATVAGGAVAAFFTGLVHAKS